MAQCLVTGGAGFIGSHIVHALVARGDKVRVLDNLSTGKRSNLAAVAADVEFLEGDLTDIAAVGKAVAGCEIVFHEAALASVPRSVEAPLESHAACATGTLNVLDQARRAGVRRVVYAASSSAYGNQPTPRKKETDLPSPLSPYAAGRAVLRSVLAQLRIGNCRPAVLQRLRAAAGSPRSVRCGDSALHQGNSRRRSAQDFRRWRPDSRFHLRRKRRRGEPESSRRPARSWRISRSPARSSATNRSSTCRRASCRRWSTTSRQGFSRGPT